MLSIWTPVAICLAVMLVSLLSVRRIPPQAVPPPDYFGYLLARLSPRTGTFILVAIGWFLISFVLGILYPWISDNESLGNWIGSWHGGILTFNYTLAVPLLVGAYVYLLQTIASFFSQDTFTGLGFTDKTTRRIFTSVAIQLLRLSLMAATLLITWKAAEAIAQDALPNPWSPRGVDDPLTTPGVFYYSLRGVNAYMALGLIALSALVYAKLSFHRHPARPELLYTPTNHEVREEIQRLGFALSLCAVLGPLVTSLHGVALILEAQAGSNLTLMDLWFKSTWIFWVVATIIATVLLTGSISHLRRYLIEGRTALRESSHRAVESAAFGAPTRSDLGDHLAALAVPDQRNYWDIRLKIQEAFNQVSILPLPKSGYVNIGLSIVVQALNIAFGVISAYIKLKGQ